MIEARKIAWFERWFAGQVRGRLATQFESVRVGGLEAFADAARTGPLLVVCNHTAYWDSLLAIALVTGTLRLDGYALMEAANLRRYPFLGRVGGFGVERDVPGDGERVLAYGAERLRGPGRVVWVFPQGREAPAQARPPVFRRGAAVMAATAAAHARATGGEPVRWVPVAVAYVYGRDPRATVFMRFGAPRDVPADAGPDGFACMQAEAVADLLAALDDDVAAWVEAGTHTLPDVIEGTRDRLGAALTWALGRLTRWGRLRGPRRSSNATPAGRPDVGRP
jgi:1-acyl-sn-glycerol-3-phosphate acyltransferase